MLYPSRDFLKTLSKKHRLVPLALEIDGDLDPISVFEDSKGSFLLQSGRPDGKLARYSFLGTSPFLSFKSRDNAIEIKKDSSVRRYSADPIGELKSLFKKFESPRIGGLPPFTGGAVGYISYDAKGLFEDVPQEAHDDLTLPHIHFIFVDSLIAFDHLKGKVVIIANIKSDDFENSYEKAVEKLMDISERIKPSIHKRRHPERSGAEPPRRGPSGAKPPREGTIYHPRKKPPFTSNMSKVHFEEMVCAAKRYIKKGDIYQANLSQRFSAPIDIAPLKLYRTLMQINPSPFAAFLNLEGVSIASSSPERLLKRSGRFVETRPIAGTRPRGRTKALDKDLSRRLLLSPKERAEHIMLVDLERNDLGRVCEYGSVCVDELMTLERYSHVTHIVSNVRGTLRYGKDNLDVIKASFPGGTITGTPKIRSIEIIDELEPVARGIYTGSIGYLGFNGEMDLNIAIRTFVIKDKTAHVQVGAGIVADSSPAREYSETYHKGEALFEAIALCNGRK